MAATLKQTEGLPGSRPTPHRLATSDSAPADALRRVEHTWQRIEHFIAYRWGQRDVEWIVEGGGDWQPPLAPATISEVSEWTGEVWNAIDPKPSPLGGLCFDVGTFRVLATVGSDREPPAAIAEAIVRITAFAAAHLENAGFESRAMEVGEEREQYELRGDAMARAFQLSGAADLLRPWRRSR